MSRMLLAPAPQPRPVRDVAAAEIALALGLPWRASDLARRALGPRPDDTRALAVLAAIDRGHEDADPPNRLPAHGTLIGDRVTRAYRSAVAPELTHDEARAALEGLLLTGHARPTASRRHRGEPLPRGGTVVVHHRRPEVALVVRGGRAISLRVNGRTVVPGARGGVTR